MEIENILLENILLYGGIEDIILKALHSPYANAKTVQDLMKIAVKLEDKMLISYGYNDKNPTEYQSPIKSGEQNNQFWWEEGTIHFVYDNDVYEIPLTIHGLEILRNAGFQEYSGPPSRSTYLCQDKYPTEQKEYWKQLKITSNILEALRKRDSDKELKQELVSICEKKGLKHLSPELYERCFCIPDRGVKVRRTDRDEVVKNVSPELFSNLVNRENLKDLVGKYTEAPTEGGYDGVCTFIDFDGTVYITKSKKVIDQLQANGFEQSEEVRHVGLGWYDEFEDPWLQKQYSETIISDEEYEKRKAEREKDPYGQEAAAQELIELREKLKQLQEENELLRAHRDNSFNTVFDNKNEPDHLSDMLRDVDEPVDEDELVNSDFIRIIKDSNFDNNIHGK